MHKYTQEQYRRILDACNALIVGAPRQERPHWERVERNWNERMNAARKAL
jgi:hypothetical protein